MNEVVFHYKGQEINVDCELNDKMEDKYIAKISANKCFMYNGKKIDKEKTLKEQLVKKEILNGKMNVFVYDNEKNDDYENEIKTKSKQIIYPECKEELLINIKEYRLNLNCKNRHIKNDITLEKYEYFHNSFIKYKCESHKENYIMYCEECKENMCLLCKIKHNETHNCIHFEDMMAKVNK